MSEKVSLLSGSLLVAGTAIGGGMLALPVLTSPAGFIPSLSVYLVCWLFMSATGLLFLEVSQWMKEDSNIVSMADYTLGKFGRYFAWVLYLFLFYCLLIAYVVGLGNIITELSLSTIPDWLGPILFVLLFAPLILIPTFLATKLNVFLVGGLVLSYFAFIILGFSSINLNLLRDHEWSKSLLVLPIAFTSFAYQGIIPTLVRHMHGDVRRAGKAILIGSFIPLVAYIIWEGFILGIVPKEGPGGLLEALSNGDNAVYPLRNFIQNPYVYYIGQSFAFFALVTSFLGVSLGLRDFLADGLKISQDLKGKILLAGLIFIFPLVIGVLYPHVFLIALSYAGGFGCALLLGLLPILMVWRGRYKMGHSDEVVCLPGGRVVLVLLAIFVLFEITSEVVHVINRMSL